jgi:UDP-N-acetylglucosamine 1-carboxyvinyltransferase
MVLMDKLVIEGGKALKGTVPVSGSKNAVLPIMAATLLAPGQYHLENVPRLRDVTTMSRLLKSIGAGVRMENHTLDIDTSGCDSWEAPYDLVKTMRASIYVLGPLLSRFGNARVSLPGGCAWGPRPVNLHLESLKKLGADIRFDKGYIMAKAGRLKGARIAFDVPSVGATGNTLMAALCAQGTTVIENAAKEPEITALIAFLNKMGAQIHAEESGHITIHGMNSLKPVSETIIPDRIEAGTFLVAGHITGGNIELTGVNPSHMTALIAKLRDSGARIEEMEDSIILKSHGKIKSVDITTAVYPGFPTDMQAQWMALMCVARGSAIVTESIFLDRFTHVAELQRLGADITLDHNVAVIKGVNHLSGARVMSTDLRASASLILAGLVADGRTDVSRIYHIDRGYEKIESKLENLGARIRRDQEELVT